MIFGGHRHTAEPDAIERRMLIEQRVVLGVHVEEIEGPWVSGEVLLDVAKEAAQHNGESKPIDELTQEAADKFSDLFLNGGADQLGDLDALSLYYDFRQLTPPGAKGDEMIRNLARRLVKVDLLPQAADLLQYQIDNRLNGVSRAQVATDLALIRIADQLRAAGAACQRYLPSSGHIDVHLVS